MDIKDGFSAGKGKRGQKTGDKLASTASGNVGTARNNGSSDAQRQVAV